MSFRFLEAHMASIPETRGLSRIGAVDAFIVTVPSDAFPIVGSIALGVEAGSIIVHASLYDAVRLDFLHGLADASVSVRNDSQKRAVVRMADAIARGFEPGSKKNLVGALERRRSPRDKRSATARKYSPLRAVRDGSVAAVRTDGPVTPAMLVEKRRDGDLAASIPWADATFLALVAETRRSLKTIQICDIAVDAIVADKFSKGLKAQPFQRRAMSASLTALRADVTALEAAPFLDLRHGIEGHIAVSARAALDSDPRLLMQGINALRSFVAIHRVRVMVEVERSRCAILAALVPAPDPADHDRLLRVLRSVDDILYAGEVSSSWRGKVGTGLRSAAEALQYLEYAHAEAKIAAVCAMLP